MKKESAIFAMGCFWKPEEIFSELPGVIEVTVGYSGGKPEFKNPSYGQVCSGSTEHAESIKIVYDTSKISYEELLKVFWDNHDPTTKDRQGLDVGTQYRSAIFYHNENQKKAALKSIKEEQKRYKDKIVTQVIPEKAFYPAEEYHQKYIKKQKSGFGLIER